MLSNEKWFGAGVSAFYPETIDQSLRFDGSTSKLLRTPTASGNQKKWTSSMWVKRSELGILTYIWSGASYSGNDGIASLYFHSSDKLYVYYDAPTNRIGDVTSEGRLFRDTTNWYHIVWAVDAVNTVHKIWVNGELVSTNTSVYPTNFDYGMNRSGTSQAIGTQAWGNTQFLDGYIAEFVHLDGQYLDETYFGEFKNGVWVGKNIDDQNFTFGTNGFYLPFSDSSNIGYDYQTSDRSGTTNDFTSSGLASTDVYTDSPTNNLATLNPLYEESTATLSEGNLKISGSAGATEISTIAFRGTQKFYYEVKIDSISSWIVIGILETDGDTSDLNPNMLTDSRLTTYGQGGAYYTAGSYTSSGGFSYTTNDIVGILFDNGTMTAYKNGVAQTPVQSSISTSKLIFAYVAMDNASQGMTLRFAEQDWTQAPTGVDSTYELSSTNLDDTTLSPNQTENASDYFNTRLYSGDGQTTQAITGVGFQPDWLWIKERSSTSGHVLLDSNRGASKFLVSHSTQAESTATTIHQSFDSDGFTVGSSGATNENGQTYVSWNWLANGGTTSTDTNGDVNSTVQVSSDAKFSIVTFTGSASASTAFTVGHGLGSPPKLIIAKQRNLASSWLVYHHQVDSTAPEGYYMLLNTTGAKTASSTAWGNTAPTSTVFTTYTTGIWGTSAEIVAYCFDEVEGYSKFGTYTGNGSTDGTYVHLGFRPSWIIVKRINSGYSWIMNDNKRDPINEVDLILIANDTGAENGSSTVDFDWLSNGFKCKNSNSNINTNGSTYIYMAFAEQPFKFSNAR